MNQALNNLLSREDDDGDEESSGIVGLGIPSGGRRGSIGVVFFQGVCDNWRLYVCINRTAELARLGVGGCGR